MNSKCAVQRERERQTDRQTERARETQRDRQTDREEKIILYYTRIKI